MTFKSFVYAIIPTFSQKWLLRIEQSAIGYRFARGAFWSFAGAVIVRGFGLLASIIVARILGKVGFGELGVIQSTVGIFGSFAGFGLGLTSTKYLAEFRTTNQAKAGRVIVLSNVVAMISGGGAGLVLIILAPWLSNSTLAAPHLSKLLQVSAGLLFLSVLTGAQTGALAGFEAFKTIAWVNILSGVLTLPFQIGGAYWAGLQGAIWGLVACTGVNWLLNHFVLRRLAKRASVPLTFRGCWEEKNILRQFSLPSFLSSMISGPIIWISYTILVNQPSGYASMGIYNAVLRVKVIPEMIVGMLLTPLLPMLSEQFAKSDFISFNKTVNYALAVGLVIVVPISLIQMAAPMLTLLPFGRDFQGNHLIVQWLMFQAMLNALISPLTHILASMNRMWFAWKYSLYWGVLYILFSYLLIPHYGATGLAAAFAITQILTTLPLIYYVFKYEKSAIRHVPFFQLTGVVILFSIISLLSSILFLPAVAAFVGFIVACLFVLRLTGHLKVINAQ